MATVAVVEAWGSSVKLTLAEGRQGCPLAGAGQWILPYSSRGQLPIRDPLSCPYSGGARADA
jgi:hypothetical protein